MRDLQKRVAAFIREHHLETDPATRLLDLTSEVGELAKAYVESTGYGASPFQPDDHWAEELGDALFALIALALGTQVDLEEALERVLRKYDHRVRTKGHAGSGA